MNPRGLQFQAFPSLGVLAAPAKQPLLKHCSPWEGRPCQATAIKSVPRDSLLSRGRARALPGRLPALLLSSQLLPVSSHSPNPCQNRKAWTAPHKWLLQPLLCSSKSRKLAYGKAENEGVAVPPVIRLHYFPCVVPSRWNPTGSWAKAGSGPRRAVRLEEEGEGQTPAGFRQMGSAGLHVRVSA